MTGQNDYLSQLQQDFRELIKTHELGRETVEIKCAVLTAVEAIGNPERNDFPIQKGKEKMMQASFGCSCGQAFTDMPNPYSGTLEDVAAIALDSNYNRAVFVAALNAVTRELKMADHTVHCKDEGPKKCSLELAEMIEREYGRPNIALFGLQPAMAEVLAPKFPLRIFDLDDDNIGHEKFGVVVESGICDMHEVEDWADVFLVTGSTMCNGSIVEFLDLKKPVVFFGTTIAGAAGLKQLLRFCPQSA